eukprot:scaffold218922_cov28-Prasinocladus_malaysianus.AAC.1
MAGPLGVNGSMDGWANAVWQKNYYRQAQGREGPVSIENNGKGNLLAIQMRIACLSNIALYVLSDRKRPQCW